MRRDGHLELDQQTGVVDVYVLDVVASVESLLWNAHQIQRRLLRVRGIPKPKGISQRRAAASQIRKIARKMSKDSQALLKVLRDLEKESDSLLDAARE